MNRGIVLRIGVVGSPAVAEDRQRGLERAPVSFFLEPLSQHPRLIRAHLDDGLVGLHLNDQSP